MSLIDRAKKHSKDCGSSEVQIAKASEKISLLEEHFKIHKNDIHSLRGLYQLINRRKRLLKYLKNTNLHSYHNIITLLSIRQKKTYD
jgi:small subunit ribosomal protein S15